MAYASDKTKVQVTLSNDSVRLIDEYAKMVGTSRSQFCSNAIGEKLLQLKLIQDVSTKALAETK